MTSTISYYFSLTSPWAYLGHEAFREIVARHGAKIDYRPVDLINLFGRTGGLPVGQRHISRQRYRFVELQRWREKRNVPLNLSPRHWPFTPALPDSLIIAAVEAGHDPAEYISRGMRAVWAEDRDLIDAQTVKEIADQAGLPGDELLAAAQASRIGDLYEQNKQRAEEDGCFGSPTYILKGEIFWGQDRLDLLDDALRSGREPFLAPE